MLSTNIRDVANSLAGKDANEIEAYLLVFLSEIWRKEWNSPKRKQAANRNGYFWLPCLVCGEWYSGDESSSECECVMIDRDSGRIVCPSCSEQTRKINERWPNGVQECLATTSSSPPASD